MNFSRVRIITTTPIQDADKIRQAHPYEEPMIDTVPLISEKDL
jgi:hypothetical protein